MHAAHLWLQLSLVCMMLTGDITQVQFLPFKTLSKEEIHTRKDIDMNQYYVHTMAYSLTQPLVKKQITSAG